MIPCFALSPDGAYLERLTACWKLKVEKVIEQQQEAIRDVEVEVEALMDDGTEGDLDHAVGPDRAGENDAIEEVLPVADVVEKEEELYIGDAVSGGNAMVVEVAELVEKGGVKASIKVKVVGADKGDGVLGGVAVEDGGSRWRRGATKRA